MTSRRLMVMLVNRLARTVCALMLAGSMFGCAAESPEDRQPSSSAKSRTSSTPSTEQELTLEVGHCFIEPIRAFGEEWGLTEADQFGWGDAQPRGFSGDGVATRRTDGTLLYVDQDGRELTFLPASNRDVYDTTPVVCD